VAATTAGVHPARSSRDRIFICPPQVADFALARERGYLARCLCPGWFSSLIKTVVAGAGQHVLIDGSIAVDGTRLAHSSVRPVDAQGRALAPDAGGIVPAGKLFLFSEFAGSYDSRYFGPIPAVGLLGLGPTASGPRSLTWFDQPCSARRPSPSGSRLGAANHACCLRQCSSRRFGPSRADTPQRDARCMKRELKARRPIPPQSGMINAARIRLSMRLHTRWYSARGALGAIVAVSTSTNCCTACRDATVWSISLCSQAPKLGSPLGYRTRSLR